ncbi:MAG: aldose 1-epimerase [Steroidobacteraceae bacterium]
MSLPDLHEGEIELRCGTLLARVRRDIGGGVSGFWRLDATTALPILRPAASAPRDPRELSSFPLVPFCNRIEDGRFVWRGRQILLSPNATEEEFPLHGFGWQAAWNVVERTAEQVILAWRHERAEWPWMFETQQRIALSDAGLELCLSLTNADSTAMPAGLGWHPYFPLTPQTRLTAEVEHKCETNARSIPTRLVPVPKGGIFGGAAPYGNPLDSTFLGWQGEATIEQADPPLSIKLAAEPLPAGLAVFIPPDSAFLCVEPVTHAPNALNDPICALQMRVLQPGERMELTLRMLVT